MQSLWSLLDASVELWAALVAGSIGIAVMLIEAALRRWFPEDS